MSPETKVDIDKAKAFFARLKDSNHKREGQSKFMPYVMIRSCAGDNGTRPLPAGSPPFWESPDIWTAVGDPAATPAIPPNQGGTVVVGKPNTVYAHVWNLGRAPIAGATVEWYWFNPSLGIDGAHAHLIGTARVELAPRGFPGCHKLVKCPQAWVPVMENGGHECLVARISAFGDPLSSAHPWDAWADRHVAQKNLTVVAAQADVHKLVRSLDATRPKNSTVRLFQIGEEASHSLALTAPHLKLDPAVATNLLAELKPGGDLTLAPLPASTPRIMPHLLLNLGSAPRVAKKRVKAAGAERNHLLHEAADVPTLLHHGNLLSSELMQRLDVLPLPKKGEAQVLKVISYDGDKPNGGYTIVVSGS